MTQFPNAYTPLTCTRTDPCFQAHTHPGGHPPNLELVTTNPRWKSGARILALVSSRLNRG